MLPCPECGLPAVDDVECRRCGLVYAKWQPKLEHKRFDYSLSWTLLLLVVVPLAVAYWDDAVEWLTMPRVQVVAADPAAVEEEERAAAEQFEPWYPDDDAHPDGLRFPCAHRRFPTHYEGVPASHRRFLDHSFALILQAAHRRMTASAELAKDDPDRAVLESYLSGTREIAARLAAEPAPRTLEAFKADVLKALELQGGFFVQAFEQRRAGVPLGKVMASPEKKAVARKLLAARARLKGRYPRWDDSLKESVTHHLCNLSLY